MFGAWLSFSPALNYPQFPSLDCFSIFPFFTINNPCHCSLFSHSISFSLSFSASLTPSLSHTHMQDSFCPEESLSITQSGSQVNLLSCQMCHIGLLSGVKSPHYGPKAKLRKWMKLTPVLFPLPHDPLTILCVLCTSTSPFHTVNIRTTFSNNGIALFFYRPLTYCCL